MSLTHTILAALAAFVLGPPDNAAYRDYVLDGPDDEPLPDDGDDELVAARERLYATRRAAALIASLRDTDGGDPLRMDTFGAIMAPSPREIALDRALNRAYWHTPPHDEQQN